MKHFRVDQSQLGSELDPTIKPKHDMASAETMGMLTDMRAILTSHVACLTSQKVSTLLHELDTQGGRRSGCCTSFTCHMHISQMVSTLLH